MARGESNAAIADALTISVKTVRNHLSNIFSKLQGRGPGLRRYPRSGSWSGLIETTPP